MNNQRKLFFFVFSLIMIFQISGFSFNDLNLSTDDRLLFKADFESQQALFVSALDNMSIQQLTVFPEKLQLVDNGRTVVVTDRFGAFTIPASGGLPAPLPGYPSFAAGNVPLKGRVQEAVVSFDGKWYLFIEPVSPAYGNLFIIDTGSGAKHLVSENVELPAADFPAKWSPNSRLVVYSKGGRLYYFPVTSDLSAPVSEHFRMIGPGGINSIMWGQNGHFFYFLGSTLYCVRNQELFTRTVYGDFLSVGSTAASFPFDFEPGFDRYWIAPDAESVLINKNGKGFFIFLLGENQAAFPSAVMAHTAIPYGAENINVLWSASQGSIPAGSTGHLLITYSLQNEVKGWRFQISGRQVRDLTYGLTAMPASSGGALSPDGSKAVFWGRNGAELWDFAAWQFVQQISREPVLSCAWINNGQFISAGSALIEAVNITATPVGGNPVSRRRICLSGADEAGFEEGRSTPRIIARTGNLWFATDGRNPWTAVSNPQLLPVSLSSERYRVFLETQHSGHFANAPMIRSSGGAVSLVAGHSGNAVFTAGRLAGRLAERQMQIALCFDLYDDDTGLQQVLAALRRNNIKATFFLNGDFIRRNPLAAAAIAAAGHETASMFYAPIDFSDSRYRITQEFITRGLARNEDEFRKAAGKELSLLWHPPFYRSSAFINAAAASAGYVTVDRTLDIGDWLSREDAFRLNLRRVSASQMIEQIAERSTDRAVVPVRLGLLGGGRDDYLFQRIDVLLDALVRCGIEIVTVSAVTGR